MMALFESHAYEGIFAALLLDTVRLPVPGEIVLLGAGFLASAGRIELLPAILLAALGAVFYFVWKFRQIRRHGPTPQSPTLFDTPSGSGAEPLALGRPGTR